MLWFYFVGNNRISSAHSLSGNNNNFKEEVILKNWIVGVDWITRDYDTSPRLLATAYHRLRVLLLLVGL